jgi:hypothetical protein
MGNIMDNIEDIVKDAIQKATSERGQYFNTDCWPFWGRKEHVDQRGFPAKDGRNRPG